MTTAMSWVLFGFMIWALCHLMKALERRIAPASAGDSCKDGGVSKGNRASPPPPPGIDREAELARLRERVEVLEAIVTDRKYQWDRELRS